MAAKNKGKTPTPPRPAPRNTPSASPKSRPAATTKNVALRTNFLPGGFWRQGWLPVLVLLVLPFVLYSAALKFGYMLDDQMVIWQNAYVQKGWGGLREIFAYDSFMGYFQDKQKLFMLEGGRYRPLSLVTFAAEVALFGKDKPFIGHFINILLYGLNAAFLYRLLSGLFPVREGGRWYFSIAFIASLVFVLHPLHTEVVANIKGRDEILALMGGLLALYATLKYFDTGKGLWLGISCFMLLMGLLAKESALTFVAVIPLTAWFFSRKNEQETEAASSVSRRLFIATLPLLAAALIFIIIRYNALGYMINHGKASSDLMNSPFLGMIAGERFATTMLTLGWYLKLLFVPHPLTHDYYPYHVPKVGWGDWRALLSLVIYLAMGIWALMNLKKRRIPAYAIAFYLLTLSIVSNLFVSVGTFMNERFLYAPSIGFCLVVAWFLAEKMPSWLRERPERPGILAAGILLLMGAAFAWLTIKRVPDWATKVTLNASALKNSPNSARAQCFYAVSLYEEVYKTLKDPEEKLKLVDTMDAHITRALQIYPNYGSAWQMVPGISAARFEAQADLYKQKRSEKGPQMDRLFNDFDKVLERNPVNRIALDFIIKYIIYLGSSGGNPNKIDSFCYNQGYERFYKQRNDAQTAIQIMEAGAKMPWEDERLFTALAEVYEATGQVDKAAAMRQRAEVAKTINPGQ